MNKITNDVSSKTYTQLCMPGFKLVNKIYRISQVTSSPLKTLADPPPFFIYGPWKPKSSYAFLTLPI
jgi:hypothetical protein